MLKKILFYFFFPCIVYSVSLDYTNNENYNKIIKINENDLKLLNLKPSEIDYISYFYYYCLVSEEQDKIESYKKWFNLLCLSLDSQILKEFKDIDVKNFHQEKQEKFLEFILIYLHNTVFKKYEEHADRVSSIIEKQEFNCVSSSILYGSLLLKYGFETIGVETKDHIFIKVKLKNSEIDVETTNKYGFNPGSKKEVLDELGKITGYSYVPPADYKDRNDVDLKIVLFSVYNNLYLYHTNINDHIRAVNIGYIIYLGRNDNKGSFLFESFYYNYLITLYSEKRYDEAVSLINLFFKNFWTKDNLIKLRFDNLYEYVNDFEQYDRYKEINDYLLMQNESFDFLKNSKEFINIYYFFTVKLIKNNIQKGMFVNSYELIKKFNILFYFEDAINTFEIVMNNEIHLYNVNNDFIMINSRLYELKLKFPEYVNLINKYKNYYIKKEINFLNENDKHKEALIISKKAYTEDPKEHKNTLLNCYVVYASDLFKKNENELLIDHMDEALLIFPDEIILKKNYYYYLKDFIDKNIKVMNYSKARRYYYIAVEKFFSDSYLIEIDKLLKDKKY